MCAGKEHLPRQHAGKHQNDLASICIKLGCQDLLADWVRHVRAREMWLTGFDRSWFGEQGAGLVARIKRSVCTC